MLNNTSNSDCYTLGELQNIIMNLTLKSLMIRVDPFFQVSLHCAISILNEIEAEEAKFKRISKGEDPNIMVAL
jgi:hypothetical protein